MQIAQQIANCCCENRLAICQQTGTLQNAINNVAVGQERANRRRFNNVNDDWNYPNRYGERGGGGYNGGGR